MKVKCWNCGRTGSEKKLENSWPVNSRTIDQPYLVCPLCGSGDLEDVEGGGVKTCENCGCRVYGGICTNCHEELYILTTQGEDMYYPISDEFMQKVAEQRAEVERKGVVSIPQIERETVEQKGN